MPLPTEFPKEAAKILVGIATGQPLPETVVIVTAGYDLLGYGLGVAFGTPLIGAAPDDAETVSLKTQLADPAVQTQLKAALPPFVLNLIMLAIQKLIERLSK